MKAAGFTTELLTTLKVGDLFQIGTLFPALSDEGIWWQVTSRRDSPTIGVECRMFYHDIPMGVAIIRQHENGAVTVST